MTNKPEIVNEKDLIVRKDGLFYKKHAKKPFTGIGEDFLDNGAVAVTDYKDGKEDGLFEGFFENGQLKEKGNYKNGSPHGLFEEFFKDGQLKHRRIYKNGTYEGPFEYFDEDGNLIDRFPET